VSGIKKIEEVVQKVYQLNNAGDNFKSIVYPNTGHVYTADMWGKMTQWMDAHLK
jgi:dipeptidyl aminopeptidase/acylaminoacyl peptidase